MFLLCRSTLYNVLKNSCAVLCILLFYQGVIAQTKPTLLFKHLTLEDGLSDPRIQALHVDRDGFLWMGTENGLNRFDGKTCIAYNNKRNSDTFPGNYITNIIEERNGDLIIGSQSNLVKYNRKQDNFTTYPFKKGVKLNDNYYAFPFYIDKQEDLWVYLAGNVYKYSEKDSTTKYITSYSNGYLFTPIPLYKKLDWFISRGVKGIYINQADDVQEARVQDFFMSSKNQTLNSHISDVYFAPDSVVWLASDRGLIELDIRSKKHNCYSGYKLTENISPTAIVKFPNKPWLFIGTRSNGLLLFDLLSKKFFAQYTHQSDDAFSLHGNHVKKIYIDKKQNLFLSISGYGLDYTNLNKVIFSRYAEKENMAIPNFENDISVIIKPKNDLLWCGTKTSGLLIYRQDLKTIVKHEFPKFGISHLVELDNADILVGLSNGLFFLYDSRNNAFKPLKSSFTENVNGKVQINRILKVGSDLFAATEYGIARLVFKAKNNLIFQMDQGINRALPWPNIQTIVPISAEKAIVQSYYTCLYLAEIKNHQFTLIKEIARSPYGINGSISINKTLYLATTSGLFKFNTYSNTIQKIDPIEANCSSILADRNNNLWIGTNNGLYLYNIKNNNKTRYTVGNGLQSMVFNTQAAVVLASNQLVFGGINGINIVNPAKSAIYNSPSKPQITGIWINDQVQKRIGNPIAVKHLALAYDENTLTIAFSTMDFIDPSRRKIVYEMLGYDNKKVTVFGSNSIRFPNMPPGKFKLVLTDTYSNKQTVLSINITAPFWKKAWFIALCTIAIAIIISVALVVYLRWLRHLQVVQLRQMINHQKADRKRIGDYLHDELGLKLSSLKHYLLAGDINKMIDSGELRKLSAEYIDSSVNILRNTLINLSPQTLDENGLVTALEDLTESINKLGIIKIYFDHSGFTLALKSTPEYTLYRICQELISNTIKHAGAKNIYIVIINRNEKLILLYEDDGKGYDYHEAKRGYGLFNIEALTQAIRAEMDVDSAAGKGVAVTITLNLKRIIKPN